MKFMRHVAKNVDDWTRLEAEFSGSYAHQFTDAIKNCNSDQELKNILLSSILDRYMFFYTKSNRPHKITKSMLKLLDKKNFQFESPSPRSNKLEQSINHLVTNSGLFPTLWKTEQIWGDETSIELLLFLYEFYKEHFEPNDDHEKWISNFKNVYVTDGKPWKDYF